jgi:hypothetical protein
VFGIGAAGRFAASLDEISNYLENSMNAAERARRRTADLLHYRSKLQGLARATRGNLGRQRD